MTNWACGWCWQCGKFLFATRKLARRAARQAHPGNHMSAYRCSARRGEWHIGNLPPHVIAGRFDRSILLRRDW